MWFPDGGKEARQRIREALLDVIKGRFFFSL